MPTLSFAAYNVQWMKDLFHHDGRPLRADDPDLTDRQQRHAERSIDLAAVVAALDADVLCIVEGPDTLADGSKTSVEQLEAWRDLHEFDPDYRAIHGITSSGQQELCALYRQSRVAVEHIPERRARKHPFDEPFLVDTLERLVKEQYEHYRPPLELALRDPDDDTEWGRVIVAHAKSKGIFDIVDLARFEQLFELNRRKLYAECLSIRERCDQWLEDHPDLKIVVCGDINDGFGLDHFEGRFHQSAVDLLLGDVWAPERILKHVLPKPRLNRYGWYPSSSEFRDRITGDEFNVLIDHILVSQNLPVADAMVWNPGASSAPDEVRALRTELRAASDHFPISANLTF